MTPKKARNINDYESVVAEWDRALAELQAFGGETPNYIDIMDAYLRLLDDATHGWAINLKSQWAASGEFVGDAPEAMLSRIRAGVECRVQQWTQLGANAPLAGMGYIPPPGDMPLNSLTLPAETGDMDESQLQKLVLTQTVA